MRITVQIRLCDAAYQRQSIRAYIIGIASETVTGTAPTGFVLSHRAIKINQPIKFSLEWV